MHPWCLFYIRRHLLQSLPIAAADPAALHKEADWLAAWSFGKAASSKLLNFDQPHLVVHKSWTVGKFNCSGFLVIS
jgi:hypothetical protein